MFNRKTLFREEGTYHDRENGEAGAVILGGAMRFLKLTTTICFGPPLSAEETEGLVTLGAKELLNDLRASGNGAVSCRRVTFEFVSQ